MPIEVSNRIFLITEKTRINSPIKIALNSLGYELTEDYPALTSIPMMQKGIARSGKTAFIRAELLRFIQDKGFPRAIIMDSQIDLAIDAKQDPGMLKILKTFLIAYVILSKGVECRNLHGAFLLLTQGASFEKEFGIGSDPHSVMNLLSTNNPEINFFIDELRSDRERFLKLFSIELLDTGLSSDLITESVTRFLMKSSKAANDQLPRHETIEAHDEDAPAVLEKPEPAKTAGGAVRVLFRIDEGSVYDDGEIVTDLTDEHRSLAEREFYIIGTWSVDTGLEVSKKIAGVVQKGISEKARFGYSDPVVFNIDDRCVIDKDTTLSMAQLFTKNLSLYKKISIKSGGKNAVLIQKSRGFPMIKNIFKNTDEQDS